MKTDVWKVVPDSESPLSKWVVLGVSGILVLIVIVAVVIWMRKRENEE